MEKMSRSEDSQDDDDLIPSFVIKTELEEEDLELKIETFSGEQLDQATQDFLDKNNALSNADELKPTEEKKKYLDSSNELHCEIAIKEEPLDNSYEEVIEIRDDLQKKIEEQVINRIRWKPDEVNTNCDESPLEKSTSVVDKVSSDRGNQIIPSQKVYKKIAPKPREETLKSNINPQKIKLIDCEDCESRFQLAFKILTNKTTSLYQCPVCRFSSTLNDNFREHLATHSGSELFKCFSCNKKRLKESSGEKKTVDTASVSKISNSCSFCDFKTSNKVDFLDHLAKHLELKFVTCPRCNYRTNQNEMKNHMVVCYSRLKQGKGKNNIKVNDNKLSKMKSQLTDYKNLDVSKSPKNDYLRNVVSKISKNDYLRNSKSAASNDLTDKEMSDYENTMSLIKISLDPSYFDELKEKLKQLNGKLLT